MKQHQLRYLALFAQEGSVRATAREAGVSAASVTQGLRELEQDAQLALFDRQGGHIQLSSAGLQLLPYAQRISALLQQAEATAARLRNFEAPQKLSIGVTPWVAQTLLSQVVPLFRQQMPHVQLELFDGLSALAYPRLREGSLDLLIGRLAQGDAMHGLEATPLFRYEMTVVARKDHPQCQAQSLSELLNNDWIVNYTPQERGSFMANLFGQHGLPEPVQQVHLAHSPTLMLTLVQQTDMLSFCPWPLVETMELRDKIIAVQLRERFRPNTVGFIRRAQEALNPAAHQFKETFELVVRKWQDTEDLRLRRVLHSVDLLAAEKPV
ncbi:LysR family transcriptional regulator [Acidovorax sp. Be4]|uniref:LysR family transcriptional regulator n=1 Tax=Acidovorax bellezanensis TaxID=2976702 RepID=A0ABT2PPZ0_9BURK|nr:LysR family transcriptional regulator [Acidovorax sp. Be4]MCT9811178.1 LysR family transcriptional regulator [Acidovorax sp. Be4]